MAWKLALPTILAAMLAAPLAHAGEPCTTGLSQNPANGTVDDLEEVLSVEDVTDLVKELYSFNSYGLPSCSDGKPSKKCEPRAQAVTLRIVNGITVCRMNYSADFDCDDFAWAFDEECQDEGVPCWQARLYATDSWLRKNLGLPVGESSGHVVNVVQTQSRTQGVVRYSLIEPQNNQTVVSWVQREGETPDIPTWAYEDLGDYFPWFEQKYQTHRIFRDGHSVTAGEPEFTKNERIRRRYQRRTGNDPGDYDAKVR
jgi:hypothetical protein